ncbi:hypothetical protein TGPRC2_306490 [Toxoplasma gondii TgCatPRC2]|uniref:BSD domain-containing protein n=3 Tax=Toxoplasma gondii TaxID=5811 RepID=A0A151H4F5_TOXGO|nr:hypothetical protein TGME49_306490 [Toxoplasma gondii ME49]EPT27474.1 hypothetical protein TGME49_306490 [Toxoplasma gondii ME49]KYF44665.1 hypothetical protein TGARI_306490 [Toxoplasma gondii ARI]KYK64182.1 hypothetical protein TGPRC2_306490 [Toxoplasma gondii TgCatPRC2]|eukprot:XP_002370411.1 hypothetical protein TGME49_306490 [Toxoplasma gondii ME49]
MENRPRQQTSGHDCSLGTGDNLSSRPGRVDLLRAHISPTTVKQVSVNHERKVVGSSSSRSAVWGISPDGSNAFESKNFGLEGDSNHTVEHEVIKEEDSQKKSPFSCGSAPRVVDSPGASVVSREGRVGPPSDGSAVVSGDDETDATNSEDGTEDEIVSEEGRRTEDEGDVTSRSDQVPCTPPPMWVPEVLSDESEETPLRRVGEERHVSDSSSGGDGYLRGTRQGRVRPHAVPPLFHTPSHFTPVRATSSRLISLSSDSERMHRMAQKVQTQPEMKPKELDKEAKRKQEQLRSSKGDNKGIFKGLLRQLTRGYTGVAHLFDGLASDFKPHTENEGSSSNDVLTEERTVQPSSAVVSDKRVTGNGTGVERFKPRVRHRLSQECRPSFPEKPDEETNLSTTLPTKLKSLFSFASSHWNHASPGEGEATEAAGASVSGSSSFLAANANHSPSMLDAYGRPPQKRTQRRSFFGSVAAAASNAFAEAGAVAAAAAEAVAAVGQSSSDSSGDSSSESDHSGRERSRAFRGKGGGSNEITTMRSQRSAGHLSFSREPERESDQGEMTPTGETSGSESELDQVILTEHATPFNFVLWATREAAASLQRPLLSGPPEEEAGNAEELRSTENAIHRRELQRLGRLRAVALRLLLLICEDDSWCQDGTTRQSAHKGANDGARRRFPPIVQGVRGRRRSDRDTESPPTEATQDSEEVDRLWSQWINGSPETEGGEDADRKQEEKRLQGRGVSRSRYMWKAANRMLSVDRRLRKLHSDTAVRRMGETEFWKLYFYQVFLLMNRFDRQAHKVLRSLSCSFTLTTGEGGDENQPQEVAHDVLSQTSGFTESDTSSPSPSYGFASSPCTSARLIIPPTGLPDNTEEGEPLSFGGVSLEPKDEEAPEQVRQDGLGALAYAIFSSSRSPSLSSSSSGTTSVSARGTGSSFSRDVGESPLLVPRDSHRSGVGSETYSAGGDSPALREKVISENAGCLPLGRAPSQPTYTVSSVSSNPAYLEPASRRGSFSVVPVSGRRLRDALFAKRVSSSSQVNGRISTSRGTMGEDRHQDQQGDNRLEGPSHLSAHNSLYQLGSRSGNCVQIKVKELKELDGTCGDTHQPGLACKGKEVQGARA